jgi:hypothetical protein
MTPGEKEERLGQATREIDAVTEAPRRFFRIRFRSLTYKHR